MNYLEEIRKFVVYPQQVNNFGLVYCYLGIIDEQSELVEKLDDDSSKEDIIKELGDILFYIVMFAYESGINIDINDIKTEETSEEIIRAIPGMIKKYYRDNKPLDKEILTSFLSMMLKMVEEACDVLNTNIQDVARINVEKLSKRKENNTIKGDGDNR